MTLIKQLAISRVCGFRHCDVMAMLVILAVLMGALDSQTPGIKKVLAETIQDAIKGLPDQDNPHGMRETMQVFYDFITRDEPLEMLFH